MKRKEIIKRLRKRGLSRKQATIVIDAVLRAIESGLETSDIVHIGQPADSSKVIIAYRGNEKCQE